jgi:hypothetical protein
VAYLARRYALGGKIEIQVFVKRSTSADNRESRRARRAPPAALRPFPLARCDANKAR